MSAYQQLSRTMQQVPSGMTAGAPAGPTAYAPAAPAVVRQVRSFVAAPGYAGTQGAPMAGYPAPAMPQAAAPQPAQPASAARRVRTASKDTPMPPGDAMKLLREGNQRFVKSTPQSTMTNSGMRMELVDEGQAPHTAVVGCADSRAPVEAIFDALPGDIFVLRNAGNTCTHAEGSMVGSLEFCTGKLKTRMVLVLGHTKCGAIYGATKTYLSQKKDPVKASSALEGLLGDLKDVAIKAEYDMGPMADEEFVAAHAVKVNVFHTIDYLLKHSKAIRDGVKSGQIEIQGAVYDLSTGVVDFMGRSTRQAELLESEISMPPTVLKVSKAGAALRGVYGVRTGADDSMAPGDALDKLKEGNDRYVRGEPQASAVNSPMRKALVKSGQAPHTAVIGCADSRAPIETLFDCMPGEIFVLRNAGNTATHAEGSLVGSLEFCTGKLGSRLVLVLGHTQCGAIVGATKTFLDGKKETAAGSALEGLLKDLSEVAAQASESLGKGASVDELAAHAVKVNVFHTMSFLLKYSEPLRELVRSGQVDLQGGIYHLETGRVEFLGHAPDHKELLAAKTSLPPSMEGIAQGKVRTAADEPMKPEAAMKLLKDGNDRFCHGKPMAGKLDSQMRKALATAGQAPHTAIVGCADSRVPLELVFDVLPGDLFVMRNAGNTITHARGSVVGSLEFCVSALRTQMVVVLGHTACGAIKGATGAYLKGTKPEEAKGALEGLLVELGKVAANAAKELGSNASEKEIADHAVKVNVFNTIDNLIKGSSTIRDKVKNGTVDIQGGIYDLDTGRVQWLGRSPNQAALL